MKRLIATLLLSVTVVINSTSVYAKNGESSIAYVGKNNTVSQEVFNNKLRESKGKDYDVNKDSFLIYNSFCGEKIGLYSFDEDITRGAVSLKNLQKSSPTVLDYEAYYGLSAYTSGNKLYVKAYNHSKDHKISKSVVISDKNDSASVNIKYDDYTLIDCKNLTSGLYCIRTSFDTMDMDLYFYVNRTGVYTVRTTSSSNLQNIEHRKEYVNSLVEEAKVTPDDCLYNGDIIYPCEDSANHRCDTDEWINLSHELLDSHPNWSDELKVFVLTTWMTENIKYDDWRVNTGKGSRALQYNAWDGRYSMWTLKTGVCCDFSNAMVIMLREHGIPTTSFESKGHMWNLVYIDDEWQELDITTIMPYHTNTFEADNCINEKYNYRDYLSYEKSTIVVTVGDDIWTRERAYRK